MHSDPAVDDGSSKKKPNVVMFYNKTKVGVDVVDQMVRQHSTHCATRRWPVGVWNNILNIAALNAWIIYKKSTSSNISQKIHFTTRRGASLSLCCVYSKSTLCRTSRRKRELQQPSCCQKTQEMP